MGRYVDSDSDQSDYPDDPESSGDENDQYELPAKIGAAKGNKKMQALRDLDPAADNDIFEVGIDEEVDDDAADDDIKSDKLEDAPMSDDENISDAEQDDEKSLTSPSFHFEGENFTKFNGRRDAVEEIIVKPKDRLTSDFMSKEEQTECVGCRAEMIAQFDNAFCSTEGLTDPIKIAMRELMQKKCPLVLVRKVGTENLPDGRMRVFVEHWDPNTMVLSVNYNVDVGV